MILKLENTTTHQIYKYDVLDINDGKKLYFRFNIDTLNLDDGEYELELFDDYYKLIHTDILKIGDYNHNTIQYKKSQDIYINPIIQGLDIDLSSIGYNEDDINSAVQLVLAEPLAEAQAIYDNWDASNTSANSLMLNSNIVFAPAIDISNVTDTANMFNTCENLKYVPYYNTSNVTNAAYMFYNCSDLIEIPNLDFGNVIDMSSIFRGCSKLKTIPNLKTDNVEQMVYSFEGCSSLTTIPQLNVSSVKNMSETFGNCFNVTEFPDYWDLTKVEYTDFMFYDCSSMKNNTDKVIEIGANSANYMFGYCYSLQSIKLNLPNLEYGDGMFSHCSNLENVELHTPQLKHIISMFLYNSNLKNVKIDLDSAVDVERLFGNLYRLKTVSPFNLSNDIKSTNSMFDGCNSLESIGGPDHIINMSKVDDTTYMFRDCYSLRELPAMITGEVDNEGAFFGNQYYLYDLVEVGGCPGCKNNQDGTNKWVRCPNLSAASYQRIIDGLYDFRGNGSSTSKTIAFNTNGQDKITDEMIAQATAKGWTITFKTTSHIN